VITLLREAKQSATFFVCCYTAQVSTSSTATPQLTPAVSSSSTTKKTTSSSSGSISITNSGVRTVRTVEGLAESSLVPTGKRGNPRQRKASQKAVKYKSEAGSTFY
jgi:hypothetical protein